MTIASASNTLPELIMLDNLDSFTYNLVDEFYQLGFKPSIYRNTLPADFIMGKLAAAGKNAILVLSPGPGTPDGAGCLMELIGKAAGKHPMLGICLGHQALVQHYGGVVQRAPEIVHGKSSNITHSQQGVFQNITHPLPVARYHSLVVDNMPETIAITAEYQRLPMAIEHKTDAVIGFQFHPESILTTYGSNLLSQALTYLVNKQQG